jgi:hypothetical protein
MIFFSSSGISKYFQIGINRKNCPKINRGKKYWMKNVFLSFYRIIFLSLYYVPKYLVCIAVVLNRGAAAH